MRLVAEVGMCHGSVAYAKELVDFFAQLNGYEAPHMTKVAMKGQFLTPETLVTRDAPRYDNTPGNDATTQWELFEHHLSYDQWSEVAEYAKLKGVPFFASVFDFRAVKEVLAMGATSIKIASGDITHTPLIREALTQLSVKAANDPLNAYELIVSTGASWLNEVDRVIDVWKPWGEKVWLALLACTLEYPTTSPMLRRVRDLSELRDARREFITVGYSDHSVRVPNLLRERAILLTGLEAGMWEFHFTLRDGPGDDSFAVTPSGLYYLMEGLNTAEALLGDRHTFGPTTVEEAAWEGARRATRAARDLPANHPLAWEDVTFLRPAPEGSVSPDQFEQNLLGRKLNRPVSAGELLTDRHVGNVAYLSVD